MSTRMSRIALPFLAFLALAASLFAQSGGAQSGGAQSGGAQSGGAQSSAQSAAPPARAALVIGNSAYKGSPLPNPVNDATDIAAGGFSDWFLPSKDELNLMYTNLKKANLGGFAGAWLWSSSQYSGSVNAWYQDFSGGGQDDGYKYNTNSVRSCRAFQHFPLCAT